MQTLKLSKLDSSGEVILEPVDLNEKSSIVKIQHEGLSGRIYNKVKKKRKSWSVVAFVNTATKTALQALEVENYIKANVDGIIYTCDMQPIHASPLKTWGDGFWRVSIDIEERGW